VKPAPFKAITDDAREFANAHVGSIIPAPDDVFPHACDVVWLRVQRTPSFVRLTIMHDVQRAVAELT
jgi:hypothetical protein